MAKKPKSPRKQRRKLTHAERGRIGGRSRSGRKLASSLKNLSKATKRRLEIHRAGLRAIKAAIKFEMES